MRIVVILVILFSSFSAFSQPNLAIELLKKQSKRKIIMKEGKKVSYVLKNGERGRGRIASITNETVLVEGQEFAIGEVSIIRRANGGRLVGILFMAVSASFTLVSLMPTGSSNCLACEQGSDDNSTVAIGLGIAVASAGLGFAVLESTFPREIENGKWTAKIIELK